MDVCVWRGYVHATNPDRPASDVPSGLGKACVLGCVVLTPAPCHTPPAKHPLRAVNRARPLQNLFNLKPSLGTDAFVAPNASVIGDVTLGPRSSVFYGSVLRADSGSIKVGAGTNIQDGSLIRTAPQSIDEHAADTTIGANVTIGHQVSMHGVTLEDEVLVGMGAVLSHGTVVSVGCHPSHQAWLQPAAGAFCAWPGAGEGVCSAAMHT